ncbi:CHAT domain-containing protein [Puteibacter caeruleilacunae]|nr:CHAT domain-containing protein [Puteibacter caeruleilacunae]
MTQRLFPLIVLAVVFTTFVNAQTKPKIFEEDKRVLPSDTTWYPLYEMVMNRKFEEAQAKYDSIQTSWTEKKQYNSSLFLGNQFSYWLRVRGKRAEAIATIEKSINDNIAQLDSTCTEFLIACYNRAIYGRKYEDRIVWFDRFIKTCPENKLRKMNAIIHSDCANNYFRLGNLKKSWEYWDYCRANLKYFGNSARFYSRMSNSIGQTDLNVTTHLYDVVLEKMLPLKETDYITFFTMTNMAFICNSQQKFEKAVEYCKQAFKYYADHQKGLSRMIGKSSSTRYEQIVIALTNLKRFDEAQSYIEEMMENKDNFHNGVKVPSLYHKLYADLYYMQGKYDTALEQIQQSYEEMLKYQPDNLAKGFENLYGVYGDIYLKQKNYTKAIEYFEKVVKVITFDHYKTIDDPYVLIDPDKFVVNSIPGLRDVTLKMLKTEKSFYQQTKDKKHLLRLVELSNYAGKISMVNFRNLANEETLLEVSQQLKESAAYGLYASEILAKQDPNYIDTAFVFADRARSFNFNFLKQSRQRNKSLAEDSLLNDIANKTTILANIDSNSENFSEKRLETELDILRSKMLLQSFSEVDMTILSRQAQPEQLRKQLPQDAAILSNFIKGDSIYTIFLTSNHAEVKAVKVDDLKQQIKQLLRAAKTGNSKTDIQKQFYNHFIEPVESNLKGISSLIVLADEQLASIPFELFIDSNDQYLVESYAIQYKYSGKSLQLNNSSSTPNLLAIAPGFKKDGTFIAENITRSALEEADILDKKATYNSLAALDYSIKEVKEIASLFKNDDVNVQVLLDKQATEKQFKESLSAQNIIHIATHGISRGDNQSGLFFTMTDDDGEDGFLSLRELYQLNIDADLVVLSACKTATGTIKEGEGVMALPRGFVYAGAPHVMASLWKVHDKNTKAFMTAFYKYLLQDKAGYSKALQQAKIEFIKHNYLPLDWAGFVLVGE